MLLKNHHLSFREKKGSMPGVPAGIPSPSRFAMGAIKEQHFHR